jgi:dihydrolipoamide dehydrogenase
LADQAYDLTVIGAGTGGYVAAIRAAQLGLKVAVVERQPALGGTCLLWGCIPTKVLLDHAHALKVVQGAKEWGIVIPDDAIRLDMDQVQARKNRIVSGLSKGVEYLFRKNKIDWVKGTARLAGAGRVEVGTETGSALLESREVLIATGSAPRTIPGIQLDSRRIITSDQAVGLREIPKSLIVIGSGPVGVEFASMFRRFGSSVAIIELLPRLVPAEDEAISAELERSLRKQGITIHTGANVTAAAARPDGVELDARLADGSVEKLHAEYLLVAVGRRPVTDGLDAEDAGLTLEKGYVRVDELYRTERPGVSAVGDVIATNAGLHPQLAHVSSAEGIIAAERMAGREVQPLNYKQVPACTYSDPEIASVGLTERQARESGYEVRIGTFPFGVLGRAKSAGEAYGLVKIVADQQYGQVLGVHMIGPRSTELIAEATLALRLECTLEDLSRTIHAHPTFSEAVPEAARAAYGSAIHV